MGWIEDLPELFPDYLRYLWRDVPDRVPALKEIRLRCGAPVVLLDGGQEWFLRENGELCRQSEHGMVLAPEDMEAVLRHLCKDSLYAYTDEIRQGFLTVSGGHRVGIAGQVVLEQDHTIRTIKHISYLNIRIAREWYGAADELLPYLYAGKQFQNVMLISPPGCGKTTLLRDLIRQVSNGNPYGAGMTVGVVDERSELAGSYRGIPQNDVGIRTDVMDACPKTIGIVLLLRSMAPQVLAVDELGTKEDVKAVEQAAVSGVKLMLTVHGDSEEDIKKHLFLKELWEQRLIKRYVLLGKEQEKCIIRGIYDEEWKPCGRK